MNVVCRTNLDEGTMKEALAKIIADDALLEIGRKAVEDELVDLRDRRISLINRGNGLVIREYDGTESKLIRLGMEHALKIAMAAITEALCER